MLTRRFQKFLKKQVKEKNQQNKRYNRKKLIMVVLTSLALAVANRDLSRKNVKTRNTARVENQKNPTLLEKIMIHLPAALQRRMKKQTCASWLDTITRLVV